MTTSAPQALTGSLALAAFEDPRRAIVTDQTLNPDEVRRLGGEATALGGRVLETGGRRMLVYFADSAHALRFAQAVQQFAGTVRATVPERHSLAARVILGHGRLAIDGDRVRGDWPHRLGGLMTRVPAHCIAGLQSYVQQLPSGALTTVPRVLADDLLLLQGADTAAVETQMASPLAMDPGVFTAITLRVRGTPRVFRAGDCPVLIGRDAKCAVQLVSDTASRIHGRIEYVQGKFYYVDDSRNGSWVLLGSGEEIKLARDRIVLAGEGAISPGAPLARQSGEVLRYSCQSTRLTMPGETPDGDTRPLDQGR